MFTGAKSSKAVVVGGISAVVCASAVLYLYKKRGMKKSRRKPSPSVAVVKSKRQQQQVAAQKANKRNGETCSVNSSDKSDSSESEFDDKQIRVTTDSKADRSVAQNKSNSKGGSNCSLASNNNNNNKSREFSSVEKNTDARLNPSETSSDGSAKGGGVAGEQEVLVDDVFQQQRIESWYDEVERSRQQHEEESVVASKLVEPASKMKIANGTVASDELDRLVDATQRIQSTCDGEVSKVLMRKHFTCSPTPKMHCADSPSLASDGRSEESQDSGKGASMCLTSSMSPVEELIEVPPMYEFEVPQDIVGLIIGRKGTTIKWFTQESGAHIVIRHHYYSDRHKICTIEGTREQINKCLRLIRHKFPPSRFPELKLTPLLPPPIASPHSPMFDSIIHLSLPDGVKCEVVLSSLVDAGHFFIQQPTHPTFPSLSRLDQYMLAVYNQPAGVPGLPRPIDIGVICAAPVLGGWYRAQTIAFYDETDEVLVKFVDYGGYSKIPAMDLRQIRSDFMTLPFQATECCLAHIKPLEEGDGWSSRATTFLEECVRSKVVEALVVGHLQDVSMVELFCTVDDEPFTVNQMLVDNGFAQWVDDDDCN